MSDNVRSIVVSDLHIGSRYFQATAFIRFLEALPDSCGLVLNGDVVDRYETPLRCADLQALNMLREASTTHRVIWIRGNHDAHYAMLDPGAIQFTDSHGFGKRLFVTHGHRFYRLLPHDRIFKAVFAIFYKASLRLGAPPMHVAFYAKRFPRLYNVFRNRLSMNAVRFAAKNKYAAIACGHVHYSEDTQVDGIRYINTGAWTEPCAYSIHVYDGRIDFVKASPEEGAAR